VSRVSRVLGDRRSGRWAVTLASSVLMVGGGLLAAAGSAQADDINNVGTPGRDHHVTCTTPMSKPGSPPVCNAVGGDGAPGASY